MKPLPKAVWEMVLRPCAVCQRNADLPLAELSGPDDPEPAVPSGDMTDPKGPKIFEQQVVGKHARREPDVA